MGFHNLKHVISLCFYSYRECIKLIPHKKFSFAKMWLLAAQFEIRQKTLKAARQILGNAIGKAPKDKVNCLFFSIQCWVFSKNACSCYTKVVIQNLPWQIFKKYIEIELQLGNIDRCRTLYEKYLEWAPANCYAWSKYAELERSLSETERARGIFELAIAQPMLDMPELLWKVFIMQCILSFFPFYDCIVALKKKRFIPFWLWNM